jgi:hypothetical protein
VFARSIRKEPVVSGVPEKQGPVRIQDPHRILGGSPNRFDVGPFLFASDSTRNPVMLLEHPPQVSLLIAKGADFDLEGGAVLEILLGRTPNYAFPCGKHLFQRA